MIKKLKRCEILANKGVNIRKTKQKINAKFLPGGYSRKNIQFLLK